MTRWSVTVFALLFGIVALASARAAAQRAPAPFTIRDSHFPATWQPIRERTVRLETRAALAPFAQRFGAPLAHVANLFYDTPAGTAQLNVVVATSPADAQRVYERVVAAAPGNFVVRTGVAVLELIGPASLDADLVATLGRAGHTIAARSRP